MKITFYAQNKEIPLVGGSTLTLSVDVLST